MITLLVRRDIGKTVHRSPWLDGNSTQPKKEGEEKKQRKQYYLLFMRHKYPLAVNVLHRLTTCMRRAFSTSYNRNDGNFLDYVRVKVIGGTGGAGAASFDRAPYVQKGQPDGGNGGAGGSIFFMPCPNMDSLNHLDRLITAGRGGYGGKNLREGKVGEHMYVKVPFGCEVREYIPEEDIIEEEEEEESWDETALMADEYTTDFVLKSEEISNEKVLPPGVRKFAVEAKDQETIKDFTFSSEKEAPICVVKGGRGGRGNRSFGGNNHDCEKGQAGETRVLEINLKTLADVGLVGLPNAGKSSFLCAVSNAHPKVAAYPFTTLNPFVGVIEFADGGRITVADIPGLIKGAHENRGLGHQFLKHIVKARILALVVDFSKEAPWEDVYTLREELDLYEDGLSLKCKLIIANKADLLDGATLRNRIDETYHRLNDGIKILPISALHGLAITKVTEEMRHFASQIKDSIK